jgi:predicted HicB family RNase H-like nuclease
MPNKMQYKNIDEYLGICKRMGKTPNVPASGRLILRISPELHSRAASVAKSEGRSLNTWVADTVKKIVLMFSCVINSR